MDEEGSPCAAESSGGGGDRDELALLVECELPLVVDDDADGINEGLGGTIKSPLLALALPPGLLVETVAARRRLLLLPLAAAVA